MNWNPHDKPPSHVCPERFCFFWAERGDRIDTSAGEYDTLEGAVAAAKTVVSSARCGCVFGTCSRAVPSPSNRDLYEPNEPALKAAGLPWFYFVADLENLAEEFREQYLSEAPQHWFPDSDE